MIKVLNVKSFRSALYGTIKFCKENEKEEIQIIVPDKLSLFMERFLFEHMNIDSSFNIKVSTLNRFAKKSCVVESEKQISKTGSILLIHRILNENIKNLNVLKNKAYSFSYAEEIFNTISQLKASKINFEEMYKFTSGEDQLVGKIKDLALIYEKYETYKAGLLDSSDVFLMSTMFVAEGKENLKILFVGFDDFTAIEYGIIERLALVSEVNIFNYHSNSSNSYIYNHEMCSQLKNIAYIHQLPFIFEDYECEKSSLKTFLEDNLYSLKANNFVMNNELVKVFSGRNINEEIEFVARDIRYKILNGKRFDDFGVLVFGLDNNLRKIKEIFEKYEINYYIDSQISLKNSILFKFFVSILKYNLQGYSLHHIIDIINSPFFDLDIQNKRELIKSLISVNFRGKVNSDLQIKIDEEVKNEFIAFMGTITISLKDSVEKVIKKLKNIIDELKVESMLEKISKEDLNSKLLLTKSKDAIALILDEIFKYSNIIDLNDFYDVFSEVASTVKINNLPLSVDVVKIVDANNNLEIFDDLYIVGATKENAPNLKYDCGIILDGEIEKLNFSFKLSPTIAHINRLSKLRLFNTTTMFEKELTLTYSNNQSDVVKELMEKLQIETSEGVKNIVPITKFEYEKYLALSEWDYIEFLCKKEKNNLKLDENLIKNKNFAQISSKNLNIFENFDNVSATTLENYFKCPFYCFVNNILKIKKRLEIDILSLDIGNVLHEIMCKYYSLQKQVGDVYEFCKKEVFRFVEKDERLKLNIDSPVIANLIDESFRVVNAVKYIDDNSAFEPKYFEKDFKNQQALKLRNISIIGKVDRVDEFDNMIRIIDYKSGKADASLKELYYGNKLQLFLYSCAMERVLKKKIVGTFYLPLHNKYTRELTNTYSLKGFYLAEDFVVKAFDKRLQAGDKSDIVNAGFNKTNEVSKTRSNKDLTSNDFEILKNYSKRVSEQAVDEIKAGYIKPSPSDVSKHCEYCEYAHICLRNSNGVKYRQAATIDLESFKEDEDERA